MAAGFRVVVPVKPLAAAKSRLPVAPELRRRLAAAMLRDTLEATVRAECVVDLVVLSADPQAQRIAEEAGARWVPSEDRAGLNAALRGARDRLCADRRPTPTAVMMADLPAVETAEVDAALQEASGAASAHTYVADLLAGGTTLLASRNGALDPRFGSGSARSHADAGHRRIGDTLVGLRCDVDDLQGLAIARYLGLGQATAEVLADCELSQPANARDRSGAASPAPHDGEPTAYSATERTTA
jgi:2-phospho-L-lactate/phosphoenolpyruvate guanylyltransferase